MQDYGADLTKISLIGYSFGGGIALTSALTLPQVHKVAYIGGAHLCGIANQAAQDSRFKEFFLSLLQDDINTSGTRSPGAEACLLELQEKADDYDPVANVDKLVTRDILIIGGWRDQQATIEDHILPIFRALQRNGAKNVGIEIYDSDHSFENVRVTLALRVIDWIKA